MRPFRPLAFLEDPLLVRFWRSASLFWRARKAWVMGLVFILIVIVLLQLLVQVLLNVWNRNFFNALERKDAQGLWF
jgi:vitamin B12/bleomycin/antimicrobial peptide transport system ATP-binding/permease protein